MICVICRHPDITDGETTITLSRSGSTIVVQGVPAKVCANCGESYVDDAIATRVLSLAESLVANGAQIDVRRYRAA